MIIFRDGNITLRPAAVASTVTLTLPTGTANLATTTLTAGTTTVAPLQFTTGTNLTTASAGSIEYDGTAFYGTGQSTERGILPTQQLYYLNAGILGGNDTTTRSIFGVGVTLASSTVYSMEASIYFSRAAGTTSHTINFSFTGTATLNNLYYQCAVGKPVSPNTWDTAGNQMIGNVATASAVTNAMTTVNGVGVVLRGTVNVNSGGTFIPNYACSAAPGGAYTVAAGSYISLAPLGYSGPGVTGTLSIGPWA
jgi:hypothetical protein